jgi:outer membrane protein, adhesin transport system
MSSSATCLGRVRYWLSGVVAVSAALVCNPGHAQSPRSPAGAPPANVAPAPGMVPRVPSLTLKDAVQQAVLTNPEVRSRWHAIQAAEGERDAARGGLLPRLDVSASTGRERRTDLPGTYDRRGGSITLNQLIYDGFATYDEYRRLDHASRARMFDFFETSEQVGLEAARAYLDVIRYRELVWLAEDNYVEHRAVFAQTERRVRAKVARGVDLEQIAGRLALAEANLLTEVANLHDTTARFVRVVGLTPPQELPVPAPLTAGLPAMASEALKQAQARNPALLAAMETVRASQAALDTRDGANRPRLDLRLRRDLNRSAQSLPSDYRGDTAELVLTWNLFNGLSDSARNRQFAGQLNSAKDLRDKTCRDISQTLLIAFRDIGKLTEQIDYLVQHQESIGRALVAYRQQFDIGQRTLLDLLDTENELFQAKRAVVNARQDLQLAYLRTQAARGSLLESLQLRKLDTGREEDVARWASAADPAQNCATEPVTAYVPDKPALLQRAAEVSQRASVLNARERALSETSVVPGAAVQAGTPGPAPTIAPARPTGAPLPPAAVEQSLQDALDGWRAAWASGNLAAYLDFYAAEFDPEGGNARPEWEAARRTSFSRNADVRIELNDLNVERTSASQARTRFLQRYTSNRYRDTVDKTLEWRLQEGRWRIVRELATTRVDPAR